MWLRAIPRQSRAAAAASITSAAAARKPFPVLRPPPSVPPPSESMAAAIESHRKLLSLCRAGGGDRGVERHTKINKKMMVRDRIDKIVDPVRGAELEFK